MRIRMEKTQKDGIYVKYYFSKRNGKTIIYAKLCDVNGVKIIGAEASVTVDSEENLDDVKIFARNRAINKLMSKQKQQQVTKAKEDCVIESAFLEMPNKLDLAPSKIEEKERKEDAIRYFEHNIFPLVINCVREGAKFETIRDQLFDAMLLRKKFGTVFTEKNQDESIQSFANSAPIYFNDVFQDINATKIFQKAFDHIRAEDRFRSLLENYLKVNGSQNICIILSAKLKLDIAANAAIEAKQCEMLTERLLYHLRVMASNEIQTKYQANIKIREANEILSKLRRESSLSVPIIVIPEFEVGVVLQRELVREIPWEQRIRFGILGLERVCTCSYAVGAPIMLVTGVRIRELCGIKIGDILFIPGGAVCVINYQSTEESRKKRTKTIYSHRTVFFVLYAVEACLRRIEELRKMGLKESSIAQAYLVSSPDDPLKPANPQAVADYIKDLLIECGLGMEYWDAVQKAMVEEPDRDYEGKEELCDVAYGLRRNATSMMTNVAKMHPGLVDAILGHKLPKHQTKWAREITREDKWPEIIMMLERIVYDPDYTIHPDFLPIDPTENKLKGNVAFPAYRICGTGRDKMVIKGKTIGNSPVRIELPDGVTIAKKMITSIVDTKGPHVTIWQERETEKYSALKTMIIQKKKGGGDYETTRTGPP